METSDALRAACAAGRVHRCCADRAGRAAAELPDAAPERRGAVLVVREHLPGLSDPVLECCGVGGHAVWCAGVDAFHELAVAGDAAGKGVWTLCRGGKANSWCVDCDICF